MSPSPSSGPYDESSSVGESGPNASSVVEEPPEDLGASYKFAALARLGPETSAEALRNYGANLYSIEFLGGLMAIPAGQRSYLTVDLEPGQYGWVLPHVGEETIVKTFAVQ